MSTPVCIPARWGATRLPGKLLRLDRGVPVLHRTIAIAVEAGLGPVIVVADARIAAVASAWAEVVTVDEPVRNGSERIARALERGLIPGSGPLVNLQGDAVGASPEALHEALAALRGDRGATLGTVAVAAVEAGGRTTVQLSGDRAVDFDRVPLPSGRGPGHLLHLGVYAYDRARLAELAGRPPSAREQARSLEQLRWLDAGDAVAVRVLEGAPGLARAIDRPEDLDRR